MNLVSKHLQSYKRGACDLLVAELDLIRSTTTFASNSTISCWIPSFKASFNPSLNAQNSVVMLIAYLIDLAYPLIHNPLQSLIRPPPPTLPGFPHEAPSEFSLNHPTRGLNHFTYRIVFCLAFLIVPIQWKNSTAWARQ